MDESNREDLAELRTLLDGIVEAQKELDRRIVKVTTAVGIRLTLVERPSGETALEEVRRLLERRGTPLGVLAVAQGLGIRQETARVRLNRAVVAGKVRRLGRGQYAV